MLERVKNVFKNLLVYPEKMQKNLDITRGLYHSEAILIALIRKGLTRQEAYKVTQGVAMRCYEGGLDFVEQGGNYRRCISNGCYPGVFT